MVSAAPDLARRAGGGLGGDLGLANPFVAVPSESTASTFHLCPSHVLTFPDAVLCRRMFMRSRSSSTFITTDRSRSESPWITHSRP
jgi:hypothetical protein